MPNQDGNPRTNRNFQRDLAKIGLRIRPPYCLRHAFISLTQEHGGESGVLKWITHLPPKSAYDGYTREQWSRLCGEVAKLRFELPHGGASIPFIEGVLVRDFEGQTPAEDSRRPVLSDPLAIEIARKINRIEIASEQIPQWKHGENESGREDLNEGGRPATVTIRHELRDGTSLSLTDSDRFRSDSPARAGECEPRSEVTLVVVSRGAERLPSRAELVVESSSETHVSPRQRLLEFLGRMIPALAASGDYAAAKIAMEAMSRLIG